jgi:hypothetical protein
MCVLKSGKFGESALVYGKETDFSGEKPEIESEYLPLLDRDLE